MLRSHLPGLLVAGLLVACGDAPSVDPSALSNPLLAHVPEDSAYILATGEPFPEGYGRRMEQIQQRMEPLVDLQVEAMLSDPSLEIPAEAREPVGRLLRALISQGYSFKDDQDVVVYGRPLAPVVRMTVKDAAGLQTALDELASQDSDLEAAEKGSRRYWKIELEEWVALLTLDGSTLAAGVSRTADESDLLDHLVSAPRGRGGEVADAKLAEIRRKHGFQPYLTAVLETETAVRALFATAPLSGPVQEPACQEEILGYARSAPRLVVGYDELSEAAADYRMMIELQPELGKELATWSAPMPDLGSDDALFTFTLALDGQRMLRTLGDWMQARAASQSACGGPTDAMDPATVPRAMMGLGMVGNPQALHFSLTVPPGADPGDTDSWGVNALIRASNAQTLAMMGAAQLPPLQQALATPGEPIQLPPIPGLPLPANVWAIVSDQMIGVSSGTGADARLRNMARATPAPEGTLIGMQLDFGRLANVLEAQMGEGGAMRQMAEAQMTSEAGGDAAAARQQLEASLKLMETYADVFGRFEMSLRATEAGLEIRERVNFR